MNLLNVIKPRRDKMVKFTGMFHGDYIDAVKIVAQRHTAEGDRRVSQPFVIQAASLNSKWADEVRTTMRQLRETRAKS